MTVVQMSPAPAYSHRTDAHVLLAWSRRSPTISR